MKCRGTEGGIEQGLAGGNEIIRGFNNVNASLVFTSKEG